MPDTAAVPRLVDHFEAGLDAPICLTWELTYACNLACIHCLSSSGRRDPRELTTAEAKTFIERPKPLSTTELDEQQLMSWLGSVNRRPRPPSRPGKRPDDRTSLIA